RPGAHGTAQGLPEGTGAHAHVRSRLLVRRGALPAAGEAHCHEARPRDRRQADDLALARARCEGPVPAAADSCGAGQPGTADVEARGASAWLAFVRWRASTS